MESGPTVGLETVVEGLTFPTTMAFLPNGDRLIGERFGLVRRHDGAALLDQPFLSVVDQMAEVTAEKGFLGLALHPEFPETPRVYARYSGQVRDWMDQDAVSHTAVVAAFDVRPDFTGVVPDSERSLLEIPQPGPVHNGGDIAFGPDGYLYVAMGDGQRTELDDSGESWWYDQGQAAQNTTDNLRGGILRIDVDGETGDRPYAIPPENPLVESAGRDEYYAWGLRNPYRISFDGEDFYVGDVGEHIRESVYLVEKGGNYGWPIVEGSSCPAATSIGHKVADNPLTALSPKTWLAQTNRISPVKICPTPQLSRGSFADPFVEYERPGGRSVTGGYVYRGEAIPDLQGQYLFGDFVTPCPLFAVAHPGTGSKPQTVRELEVSTTETGRLADNLVSFARTPAGEVYVLTTQFAEGSGRVRRLTAA